MHSTCLHCTRDLGRNDVVETLPIGRRLAFDAAEGRLWVVCRHCARWNLVPFDTRLESIDACERLFRDTRTRYSTDNIGLARVKEGLELVRIGAPLRPEFASWRYGEQYRRRRRATYLVGGAGVGVAVGVLAMANVAGVMVGGGGYLTYLGLKAGWEAGINHKAKLKLTDPTSALPVQFGWKNLKHATISWEDDLPSLDLPHPKRKSGGASILSFRDTDLRSVGRRVAAGVNLLSGSRSELAEATSILARENGDLSHWLRVRTKSHCGPFGENKKWTNPGKDTPKHWHNYQAPYLILDKLPAHDRLAIELWMNEDIERRWLGGELTLLEREWRNAAELAKISDSLAVPETVEEELARLKEGEQGGAAEPRG